MSIGSYIITRKINHINLASDITNYVIYSGTYFHIRNTVDHAICNINNKLLGIKSNGANKLYTAL